MKRKINFYRIMAKMNKNFWKNWKMAAASRYHRVTNSPAARGMREARRLFLAALLGLATLVCFVCCRATTTTQREHQTHVVDADTLATEAQHDGHSHQQTANLDSIVSLIWQRTLEEFARQEQEHETVTETLTETVDSLGRIVRQSQRTTDRTLSRQEQQRTESLAQSMRQEIRRALTEQDSIWHCRFTEYQVHLYDSLSRESERQKQSQPAATPRSLWDDVKRFFWIAVLIGFVVFIARIKDRLPGMH